jgi:SNF2 family DNA or RNA helicase
MTQCGKLSGMQYETEAWQVYQEGALPSEESTTPGLDVVRLTQDWGRQHLARAIPGAYWDGSWWVLQPPFTSREAAVALRVFPELDRKYPFLAELRDELLSDARPFDNATPYGKRIASGNVVSLRDALNREGKWWFDFQDIDLGYVADVMRAHGGAYIGWERGLGKTLGACSLIDALDAQRTLIVAPNTAKDSVWRAELERFLPGHEVFVLPNAKAKREKMLSALVATPNGLVDESGARPPQVLVIHYEALAILERDGWWKKLGQWDLEIYDEAHRLKNPATAQAKAAYKIKSRYRLMLSGSIIMNHAEELFGQLRKLFPDRYRAKWRDWNDRYIEYAVGYGGKGKIALGVLPGREAAMRKELGVFMTYRRKADELDLPPKTEQTLLLDLAPAQRRAYDDILSQFWTILDDGTVIKTDNVLAQLTKLRQIATGLDLEGDKVLDSTKVDTALEMIRDNEDQAFVVFTWYKANAKAVAAALGDEAFLVTGEVPLLTTYKPDGSIRTEGRDSFIRRFQAGERRVFVGTLATLSESVNLQRASNAIFLDRHWNPATNVQAADRIYRIGQTKPVTITHLVARDTVDELRVLPALASKEALRRSIFGGE